MLKIPIARRNLANFSRYVGKSKISKLNPKPGNLNPLIRLPTECADSIGKTASIYETSHDGKQVFLLVLDEDLDKKRGYKTRVLCRRKRTTQRSRISTRPASRAYFAQRTLNCFKKQKRSARVGI